MARRGRQRGVACPMYGLEPTDYERPDGFGWKLVRAWKPVPVQDGWCWLVKVWRRPAGAVFEFAAAIRKPETDEEFDRRIM